MRKTEVKKKTDWREKDEELFKLFKDTKDSDELFRRVLSWHKKYCFQELKKEREEGYKEGWFDGVNGIKKLKK